MFKNAKLKIKAISDKLLSFVSGGTGKTQQVRTREKDYRKRKKPVEAKKHRY